MTAEQIAKSYNQRDGITKLVWESGTGLWRMMHQGNETRQTYTNEELVEVGTRMGWDK